MWSLSVVIVLPDRDLCSGSREVLEVGLRETLVAEASVEALNVGVLCRLARLEEMRSV